MTLISRHIIIKLSKVKTRRESYKQKEKNNLLHIREAPYIISRNFGTQKQVSQYNQSAEKNKTQHNTAKQNKNLATKNIPHGKIIHIL